MPVLASAVPFASRQCCTLSVFCDRSQCSSSAGSQRKPMAHGALLLLFLGVALQDVQAGTRKPTDPPNNTPAAEQGADLRAQTYRRGQRQQPTLHLSAQPTGGAAALHQAAPGEHPTAGPQQTGGHTAARSNPRRDVRPTTTHAARTRTGRASRPSPAT